MTSYNSPENRTSLYFTLSDTHQTRQEALEFESKVQAAVNAVNMDTDIQFEEAVRHYLDQITMGDVPLRRSTVIAFAEAATERPPISKAQVFERDDVVSMSVFYTSNNDERNKPAWLHDPDFRFILEVVVGLYRKWENSRSIRELKNRRKAFEERQYEVALKQLEVAAQILDQPLNEIKTTQDGKNVYIRPINYKMSDAARLIDSGTRQARQALGLEDVLVVDWRESLPKDVNPTDAEALKHQLAALLAEKELKRMSGEGD